MKKCVIGGRRRWPAALPMARRSAAGLPLLDRRYARLTPLCHRAHPNTLCLYTQCAYIVHLLPGQRPGRAFTLHRRSSRCRARPVCSISNIDVGRTELVIGANNVFQMCLRPVATYNYMV